MIREIRHVQCGGVLAVGRTLNITIGVESHQISHFATDGGKIRDHAVVHEGVAVEDEGVGVYLGDGGAAAGSDVCEDAVSFGVFAEGAEVKVVDGRGLGFVEGGTRTGCVLHVGACCGRVPG